MAGQFVLWFRLSRKSQGSFTCRKSATWDRRLYFPFEGRHSVDFFARKIRRLLSGSNPRCWVPEANPYIICAIGPITSRRSPGLNIRKITGNMKFRDQLKDCIKGKKARTRAQKSHINKTEFSDVIYKSCLYVPESSIKLLSRKFVGFLFWTSPYRLLPVTVRALHFVGLLRLQE
jgi:hypothetical protein